MNIAMIVHNRPRLTRQCIESIYPNVHGGCYLTVVDDSSDYETMKELEVLQKRYNFKLHRSDKNLGVGAARNLSIELSKQSKCGDYLYVSDNDCLFGPMWRSMLCLLFSGAEQKGFALLGAYNHPYNKPIGWENDGKGERYKSRFTQHEVWSCYAVGSMSWLMRWDTWDKYGPLTVTAPGTIGSSEDHEFCQKIRADGKKVGCVNPPLILNCGKTNSLGQLSPGDDLLMKQKFPEGVLVE